MAASPNDLIQTIGLGNEINRKVLGKLPDGIGRDGAVFADDTSQLVAAFKTTANKIVDVANSY